MRGVSADVVLLMLYTQCVVYFPVVCRNIFEAKLLGEACAPS